MEKLKKGLSINSSSVSKKICARTLFGIIMGVLAQISCIHRTMEVDPKGNLTLPSCENFIINEKIPAGTKKEICMNELRRLMIEAKGFAEEIKDTQKDEEKNEKRKTRNAYTKEKLRRLCIKILTLQRNMHLVFGQERLNGHGLNTEEMRELSVGEGFCRNWQ